MHEYVLTHTITPIVCVNVTLTKRFSTLTYPRRWASILPKRQWDATEQPLLVWERARPSQQIPGHGAASFQIIHASSVLESVTVLPKPSGDEDDANINRDDRQMWVHTFGQSAFGET